MPSPQVSKIRLPHYLSQEETGRFFEVIRSLRDRALFSLIYQYGLRVSEVTLLRCCDIESTRGRILVRRVKGGAWSERPLFRATDSLLRAYLGDWVAAPEAPVFPGNAGPLRKRQIQSLFKRYRDRAGLPRHLTCHSLRHSIATHLLDAGMSLEFVQDHLGHQSIRSTSIYARITDRHRAAVFAQLEVSPWIVHPPHGGGREVRRTRNPRPSGIPGAPEVT